jgi:cytochrome b subunit of formate dehydrogenase
MKDKLNTSGTSEWQKNARLFWFLLIVAVIFFITGILLGDPFDAYQTAATL